MKAITLWQPWASLIAEGIKSIETRPKRSPWSSAIGETIAIHAAVRPLREKIVFGPTMGSSWEAWPADDPKRPHPNHPAGRPPRLYDPQYAANWTPLPFGAVVATCRLRDVVPMVHTGNEGAIRTLDCDPGGDLWLVEPQRYPPIADVPASLRNEYLNLHEAHEGVDPAMWEEFCDGLGLAYEIEQRDVSDQRPFGDFAPGRWALVLDGTVKLDVPLSTRGHQGLWELPFHVAECAREQHPSSGDSDHTEYGKAT